MEFLWDSHDISMLFLEDFGMLWEFYGILMGCPLDSYGPMGFLWYFFWVPMEFLLDFCGISKVFP